MDINKQRLQYFYIRNIMLKINLNNSTNLKSYSQIYANVNNDVQTIIYNNIKIQNMRRTQTNNVNQRFIKNKAKYRKFSQHQVDEDQYDKDYVNKRGVLNQNKNDEKVSKQSIEQMNVFKTKYIKILKENERLNSTINQLSQENNKLKQQIQTLTLSNFNKYQISMHNTQEKILDYRIKSQEELYLKQSLDLKQFSDRYNITEQNSIKEVIKKLQNKIKNLQGRQNINQDIPIDLFTLIFVIKSLKLKQQKIMSPSRKKPSIFQIFSLKAIKDKKDHQKSVKLGIIQKDDIINTYYG